jgi:hypothetical protein
VVRLDRDCLLLIGVDVVAVSVQLREHLLLFLDRLVVGW